MIFSGDFLDMSRMEIKNYKVHPLYRDDIDALALGLGPSDEGLHVWSKSQKQAYYWDGGRFITWGSGTGSFSDAAAVNAIGAVLGSTQTAKMSLTNGRLVADVQYQNSLTSDQNGLKLVGDVQAPGTAKYYGTDANGLRGWFALPTGGGPSNATYPLSVKSAIDGSVSLDGDKQTPGNFQYYGTNANGIKGFFLLPNQGKTFTFPGSVREFNSVVGLWGDVVQPGNLQYYGTDASGIRGWYDLPTGGGGPTLLYPQTVVVNNSNVQLQNDQLNPGNSMYYGTNATGVKGWFTLNNNPVSAVSAVVNETDSISWDTTQNLIKANIKDGYLFSLLKIHELRFRVGEPSCPVAGDSTYILRDQNNVEVGDKKIVIIREGEWLFEGTDPDDHFLYDATTSKITWTTKLEDKEPIIIWICPKDLFEIFTPVAPLVQPGFPLQFPIIF
jgi:hypothetical protein